MGDNVPVPIHTLTIESDRVRAEVAADDGGRLAQLTIDGTPLLIGHDDLPTEGVATGIGWGSFPMVPWAGRIRHGRFEFDGVEYRLPINFDDHAIHGVGFELPWSIVEHGDHHLELRLELPSDDRWPFGGEVRQRYDVDDDGLTTEMSVTATDLAFPVALGWHPWFRKPDHVGFAPVAMYRRDDDHIAVSELVPVPDGPWDDCFVNFEPVDVEIAGVELRITSPCDHWVVYDERAYATCIEPQTGPPDAFNIAVRRLEPGATTSARYRIARR